MRRAGIQTEILTSLGLVMLLSTVVLAAVLVTHHEASLRSLVGRALWVEARTPRTVGSSFVAGTAWWQVSLAGRAEARGAPAPPIDPDSLALAEEARAAGTPLLRPGPVWGPIRFAAPLDANGTVVVARLPAEASRRMRFEALGIVGAVLLVNTAIFVVLGGTLLRRRVAQPLERLATAARALTAGETGTRVVVDGSREAADLAVSFNEMSEALAHRTEDLEKAVLELRGANQDLRRARAGLDRAERLAAVGRLAAGVAHEVGNPIGAILALLDLARRDPALSEKTQAHLERGAREGERVRRILRQLLDFSRPPRPTPVPVDLAAAATESVALVSAQRRYQKVDFRVEAQPGVSLALADASAAVQILVNLVLNAGDACQEGDSPRVRLEIRPALLCTREDDDPETVRARRAPDAVECVVADNGPGIDEGDLERLFDPFFTTKPPGEGTGLGLANAARLAEELEGCVELVQPPDGFATAFALRLPVAQAPATPRDTRARG